MEKRDNPGYRWDTGVRYSSLLNAGYSVHYFDFEWNNNKSLHSKYGKQYASHNVKNLLW